jgi:polysaccharide biosynthesis protein VpsM
MALIITLGLCPVGNAAQEVESKVPAQGKLEAPAFVPSLSAPGERVPVLGGDSSTGAAQRASSAGYELSGSGVGSASVAEQGAILTSGVKGRSLRFENGIFVYPSAALAVGHNDNVGGDSVNEKSSKIIVLRPEVVAELKRRGDRYTLSYNGNYGHYTSSSDDDFEHHDIWLAGDNYLTTRTRVGWGVGYQSRTDARGSTDRGGVNDTPDKWRAPLARVLAIYGAPAAIGRFELESSWMQKRYTNNRASTRGSDVDIAMLSGRFFYRVMPKTSLVFEARNTWSDYALSTSTNDNSYLKLLVGARWDMTAKTTGDVRVGRAYKNYESSTRRDPRAGTWEAGLTWSPLTYSVFRLETGQDIADSTGVGNFTESRSHNLVWNHNWASYITSSVNAGMVKTDYDGVARNDKTKNYGVSFFRELGYNFRAGVNWSRTKRDSNQNNLDFKRDVFMLTLEAML